MAEERMKPITLTPEMSKTLVEMEPDLRLLEYELLKARRAGIDVTDLQKRFEEMKVLRTGILKEYT